MPTENRMLLQPEHPRATALARRILYLALDLERNLETRGETPWQREELTHQWRKDVYQACVEALDEAERIIAEYNRLEFERAMVTVTPRLLPLAEGGKP